MPGFNWAAMPIFPRTLHGADVVFAVETLVLRGPIWMRSRPGKIAAAHCVRPGGAVSIMYDGFRRADFHQSIRQIVLDRPRVLFETR